jgi:hypothetical protein
MGVGPGKLHNKENRGTPRHLQDDRTCMAETFNEETINMAQTLNNKETAK